MGEQCSQYPNLSEPQKLRSTSTICEPCRAAGLTLESAISKDKGAGGRDRAAYDGPEVIDSRKAANLRRLKCEITAQLFLREDPLWGAVRDVRSRWNVSPVVGVPPGDVDVIPENWLTADRSAKDFMRLGGWESEERLDQWQFDIDTMRDRVIPKEYRNPEIHLLLWRQFLACCVVYDPPETALMDFAAVNDPRPSPGTSADPPHVLFSPARQMREWTRAVDAERGLWEFIIAEVGEKFLEPRGLDIREMVREALKSNPQIWAELREWEERHNPLQWYIQVDEQTSKDDVAAARRQIAAAQDQQVPQGRPEGGRLVDLDCAILHYRHGWSHKDLKIRHEWVSEDRSKQRARKGRKLLGEN